MNFVRRRGRARPRAADGATNDVAVIMESASKSFGSVHAVVDVSLAVPPATILGVVGPSGAGKTTMIRLMTGALGPTGGSVRVLGERPSHFRRATRERVGYMPQSFSLYPELTAAENVDFVASLFGMLLLRRRRRSRDVLRLVELWDARNRKAGAMSGGMQRRLELACALVHDPVLLFLDEPTAGIDPLLRVRIWEELHRQRDAGRTLIVTTQYVTEAEECDSVALIAEGRLVALGTPDELRRLAAGGDIIEVETTGPFDGAALTALDEVREIRPTGPRSFQAIVPDAGTATPSIVDAVTEAGGEVVVAREFRPSFDDVFAELVQRAGTTPVAPADAPAASAA
ncbi:MAG TPA: ABC transporter ATP-binding protein [Candidatus Limnocylindrales bacterium]|nr:ABC transporter ATP-binding protein [Candidatus Limnocylindrales bacterium]